MKKIIELSLENKSVNHLLFFFLLLMAYFSYNNIAKEMFPPNSLDKVTVQGSYVGANSTILDKLIVQDIEKILQNNQNLKEIHTLITNGTFHVNAEIKNNASKQKIVNNIKNEVENLKKDLPSDMDTPTVDTAENFFPLLNIAVSSNTNKHFVRISKELIEDIKKLKNLYSVKLTGEYEPILLVSLSEEKIKAYNISTDQVIQSLKALFSLYPIGSITSPVQKYYIGTKNENINVHEIINSQIKINDSLIFVKDIAHIESSYENQDVITKTDGKNSVSISVKKAKEGDSIQLSKEIRTILHKYKNSYEDINFEVISDSSFWIKTRLNVISSNIIIGLILLFIAIWVFISLKIALVVILGIPVSFAFGLIGLDFFEGSLNTLSMIGVLLSLGLLVDEAIVVSENIHRHLKLGKNLHDACLEGTMEVMPILFASMLTTIIAFLPLTMLSGGLGLFIKIIPLIVIILIISSFIESFIFLPLHYKELSFGFLKENERSIKDLFWEKLSKLYQQSLQFFIKKRYIWGVFIILFTLGTSFMLLKSSTFQLFPEFDAMSINITGKVQNNALQYTLNKTKQLEKRLLEELESNNVASVTTIIGMNSDGRSKHDKAENLFTITLNLKQKVADDFFNLYVNPFFTPFEDENNQNRTRTLFAKQIQKKIEKMVKEEQLIKEFIEFNISIPQTGVVKSDIELSIAHKDNKKIEHSLTILKDKMQTIGHIYNIKDDMSYDEIKIELDVNTYGKKLGFTQELIVSKIKNFVSLKKLSKIVNTNNNLIELKVDFLKKNSVDKLENLSLKVPNNNQIVRLKDIAVLTFIKDITTIKKDDLKKVFTVTASLRKDKMSSRKFYRVIKPTLKELRKTGVDIFIKGEEKTNNQIKKDILISLLFAFFGILLVLTWLFSSIRLSFFALSVIPLSILGVLLGHKLLGMNISFSSLLGFVGLIGIVINDTLIMLMFVKRSKNQEELLLNASLRVRPILLTSITTILGLSTLIFFASGESLLMQPLAVSIGFGLIWATVINLYYVPILYSVNKRFKNLID